MREPVTVISASPLPSASGGAAYTHGAAISAAMNTAIGLVIQPPREQGLSLAFCCSFRASVGGARSGGAPVNATDWIRRAGSGRFLSYARRLRTLRAMEEKRGAMVF